MKPGLPLLLAAAVGLPAEAPAQEAPLPPCTAPEYRQLDFWVGDWRLEYDKPDGTTGTATNTISRDDYGDCVIVERFEMPNGYRGSSYSMYDRELRKWRQMWVDNQGGTFTLVGGPVAGGAHVFEFRTLDPSGPDKALRRMTWQDVTRDTLVWRWQSLQPDGQWRDDWVLRYRRAGADSGAAGP